MVVEENTECGCPVLTDNIILVKKKDLSYKEDISKKELKLSKKKLKKAEKKLSEISEILKWTS